MTADRQPMGPATVIDICTADHCGPMAGRTSPRSITLTLPPWLVARLEAEVARGRYASLEDAVLVGARLVAGLGPRARELLDEGSDADQFVRADPRRNGGEWR